MDTGGTRLRLILVMAFATICALVPLVAGIGGGSVLTSGLGVGRDRRSGQLHATDPCGGAGVVWAALFQNIPHGAPIRAKSEGGIHGHRIVSE